MRSKENERIAEEAIRYMFMEYPTFGKLRGTIGVVMRKRHGTYPDVMGRSELINVMVELLIEVNAVKKERG